MSPSDFTNEQLGLIRRRFFAKTPEKQFFQERDLLLQAVAFPAAHIYKRYGVAGTDPLYGRILANVIDTIVRKGNRAKIKRFSVYFLHCVQEHMSHHGEEYYKAAVAARSAADSLPAVMARVRIGQAEHDTKVLVEMHRTLKSRGGRKKRVQKTQMQLI